MSEIELKPCPNPWCGNTLPVLIKYYDDSEISRVRCNTCELSGPFGASEAEAIAAWNTRTPSVSTEDGLLGRPVAKRSGEFDASRGVWQEGLINPDGPAAAKLIGELMEALDQLIGCFVNTTFPADHPVWAAFERAQALLQTKDSQNG